MHKFSEVIKPLVSKMTLLHTLSYAKYWLLSCLSFSISESDGTSSRITWFPLNCDYILSPFFVHIDFFSFLQSIRFQKDFLCVSKKQMLYTYTVKFCNSQKIKHNSLDKLIFFVLFSFSTFALPRFLEETVLSQASNSCLLSFYKAIHEQRPFVFPLITPRRRGS